MGTFVCNQNLDIPQPPVLLRLSPDPQNVAVADLHWGGHDPETRSGRVRHEPLILPFRSSICVPIEGQPGLLTFSAAIRTITRTWSRPPCQT